MRDKKLERIVDELLNKEKLSERVKDKIVSLLDYFKEKIHDLRGEVEQNIYNENMESIYFRRILNSLGDMIITVDKEWKIVFANNSVEKIHPLENIVGKPVSVVVGEDTMKQMSEEARILESKGEKYSVVNREYTIKNMEGDEVPVAITISTYKNGHGKNYIMTIRDITDRKKLEEELKLKALYDSMTGLYNRTYYDAEIERIKKERERYDVSVIMLDIDHLKEVNDEFGHKKGDYLIKETAKLLKNSFRKEDVIARIGGDEFIVILKRTGTAHAEERVKNLKERIRLYVMENPELPISLSIGFASGDNKSIEEIVKEADKKMYLNKNHNHNNYFKV